MKKRRTRDKKNNLRTYISNLPRAEETCTNREIIQWYVCSSQITLSPRGIYGPSPLNLRGKLCPAMKRIHAGIVMMMLSL